MSQPFLNYLGMHAADQQQGGMRMSQVVKTKAVQACLAHNATKYLPSATWI